MIKRGIFFIVLVAALTHVACFRRGPKKKSFWIYTSIYKDVLAQIEPRIEKQFPDVNIEFYQSGSENVATRLTAELSAGRSAADLVMMSDPLYYVELRKAGHLLLYHSPLEQKVPANFRDPEGGFVVVRVPVGVIGYNSEVVTEAEAPKKWGDLLDPKWKGKISMGSPLESGTAFMTSTQLVHKYGWPYFEALRKNELMAAGGSSAVVARIETRERVVGVALLENILEAKKRGSPVRPIYPKDGAIMMPSPMAIMAKTKDPELAKRIYDYFLSDEIQRMMIKPGRMYSPILSGEAPVDAEPFSFILKHAMEWTPKVLDDLYKDRETIKVKFLETILY